MRRYENVVEAPHQTAHDAMYEKGGFRVDVEAIDVLWLIDGAQESFRLLYVFIHGNAGIKDTHTHIHGNHICINRRSSTSAQSLAYSLSSLSHDGGTR